MTMMEQSSGGAVVPRMAGKVAMVTGGGQVDGPGIGTGKAAAILIARHGGTVVLVDREPERAEVTREEIEGAGGTAVVVAGDVTVAADCERFTQVALQNYGRLDVLVNNVGHSIAGTVVDTPEETWDQMVDINLKSVYLMSKYAIPAIADSGGGSIINISSVSALRGMGIAAYAAAKGGMISLTKEMAVEHGPQGIRVNCVAPGHVRTPRQLGKTHLFPDLEAIHRTTEAVLPLGKRTFGTGWDIGYAVLFFASDESSWISGQLLTVDGGSTSTIPAVAIAKLGLTVGG